MVQVKICGLTQLNDALVSADAGADLLGFIFYPPSKRAISVEKARQIVPHLRRLINCPKLVGVFVNESAESMAAILDQCQLDYAQLSGDESPELLDQLGGRGYKGIRPKTLEEAEIAATQFAPTPDQFLLIDAYHPVLYGGTGETSDWEIARRLVATTPHLILAGGLTPNNVAQAVRQVRPYAVDVASGVEATPGYKDHHAVRAFIREAKSV